MAMGCRGQQYTWYSHDYEYCSGGNPRIFSWACVLTFKDHSLQWIVNIKMKIYIYIVLELKSLHVTGIFIYFKCLWKCIKFQKWIFKNCLILFGIREQEQIPKSFSFLFILFNIKIKVLTLHLQNITQRVDQCNMRTLR